MIEKSLFGKFPISVEKKKFEDILEKTSQTYSYIAYPFLLFNRENIIADMKDIKAKMEDIGV